MAGRGGQTIYAATYSNVPVYEFNIAGNHVMRRRSDNWINATHILKVADYDKPARTRILEREVQKGVHEKVQGGYGKYQGTWIPLEDGKALAAKNGVLEKLMPIFSFVPGDRSPPPAPKHETAASTKPRAPRAPPQQRKAPQAPMYQHAQDYERLDVRDGETMEDDAVASESQFDEYDMPQQYTGGSRKRRRVEEQLSQAEREHTLWGEDLLDYFMLQDGTMDAIPAYPPPPPNANLDRAIDEKGHNALHWGAAMADIEVVKDLIRRGASIDAQTKTGETPLMRSVIFTNSFDKRNMDKIAELLVRTVNMQEWLTGRTVFHQIANITQSKKKYDCARYYMDCILNKMVEVLSPDQVERILNEQDRDGDTAITIAARNGARKCVRSLIGRNAAVDIPNHSGETADQLIVQLNYRRQERNRQLSSSPYQADGLPSATSGAVQPLNDSIPFNSLVPHSSLPINGISSQPNGAPSEVYRSEAALTLTTSVLPTVITKGRSMASAMDAQVADKDAEHQEAQRVHTMRNGELDAMRRQAEEYRVKEMEQTSGGIETDDQLLQALDELTRECEGLTEEEERFALGELIKANLSSPPHPDRNIAAEDHEAMIREKFLMAREITQLHHERRELIRALVQNVASASEGEDRHLMYKRLITGALNVREEDVEGMLPEIVNELEEWKGMEAAAAAAA
ncbi:hypothetical protein BAUCODRAFT_30837 [Baudoinia panamericana UAMH 10762]|uniref:HTH APSES-type domain-containing protein n=1 Tax=Baudoinia panamericana (strain UAMH 10762) TaxID=717646 RepID=M2MPC3_BAUPA|nr:uncharacterized protein BAUCODRAFT_30837 [Baudoinia panamericana UAMH 10762]EMC98571.1 hypothetical protein BAUCODRAFT_30837 [Baudoinia panamericana UAMH 10762]